MGRWEPPKEMGRSFLERQGYLLPEGAVADDPLYLVFLEKTHAPSLPLILQLDVQHLLLQRQRFLPQLLESALAKLSDFVA